MNYFSKKVIEHADSGSLFSVPIISVKDVKVSNVADNYIILHSQRLNKQNIQPEFSFNILTRTGRVLLTDLQIDGWSYSNKKNGECVLVLNYSGRDIDTKKYYLKKLRLVSTQTMPLLAKLLGMLKSLFSFLQN